MNTTKLIMKNILFILSIILSVGISDAVSQELKWDDVYYTSGPYSGGRKILWEDYDVLEKTQFLELHYKAIRYCMENMGKHREELNPNLFGRNVFMGNKVTPLVIVMMYREYGDEQKAAQVAYKYWLDSNHNPELASAEEDPDSFVIDAYIRAGMYREALHFYNIAYDDMVRRLSIGSDIKLVKTNFLKYEQNWPEEAAIYKRFIKSWKQTKQLAKTEKPKPLDPAVQNHEWFYSDKQEEVLKALEYYHANKVNFILEKALKHKDPVISAKAKEYLESLTKGAGDETKH